tara:strand:- start:143 stop:262 length:120 start_codon:yes stop_codon:yes gene_type:complete
MNIKSRRIGFRILGIVEKKRDLIAFPKLNLKERALDAVL